MPHSLFSPPRLHHSHQTEERRVTWLELFYDLVYVATLIQLGNVFGENLTLTGSLEFLLIFAALWWAWTGFTFYINRFIVDDLWHRALIYLQIVAVAFLGISVEGAFGELTAQFSIFYILVRIVLVVLYWRSMKQAPKAIPLINRYIASYLIGIVFWAASAFLPQYSLALRGLAILMEVGVIFWPGTRSLQSLLPPDPPHMRERYGIFVIIVLGESFIKTITAASGLVVNLEVILFSLMGIFVVFAMWWLYFGEFEELHLRPNHFAPYIWIYSHLPLSVALTAFGVGSKKIFLSIGHEYIKDIYILLYCGALLLFIVSMALVEAALKTHAPRFNRMPGYVGLGTLMVGLIMFTNHITALPFIVIISAAFALLLGLEIRHTQNRA